MFETAVLTNGPGSRRAFSTFAGITAQAVLLGAAILVPMIFPDAMPSPQTWMRVFMPTAPPAPPPPAPAPMRVARTVATRPFDGVIRVPTSIPKHIDMTIEEPAPVTTGDFVGVPGGIPGGQQGGVPGGVLNSLLNSSRFNPAPPVPAAVKPKPADPEPRAPARYKMGGVVKPAVPIHRVEPVYPQLAKQMRIEGVVEITGIIGTDGRMKEVQLVRGHPLLAPAALEAVRRWIYAPTTLNEEPVEVIAPITITFHLN